VPGQTREGVVRLEPILNPNSALIIRDPADRDAVLAALAEAAAARIAQADARAIQEALAQREAQTPTATPEGVAFPHAMIEGLERTVLLVARVEPAVTFGGTDLPAPDLVFCMIGAAEKPWEHVRLLARLARVARTPGALDRLRAADSAEALLEALVEEDRAHG